jgi:hypothetical protein
MAIKGQIPVEFGKVFPGGAYAAGPVENQWRRCGTSSGPARMR